MHLLSSITESFVSKAREGIKEKNTGKPVLNSSKYWEEGKIYNLANALDASATISSLLGKKREALEFYERIKTDYSKSPESNLIDIQIGKNSVD